LDHHGKGSVGDDIAFAGGVLMQSSRESTIAVVAYRFQRVYADLQTGHSLTVQANRNNPVRPFMQQSDLDSACGTHVLAMVLVIFHLAKASALYDMSRRKYGVAAEVWTAFQHTYFTGVHASEWVDLVNGLKLPLQLTVKHGAKDNADGYAIDWLMKGDLVALAFASIKHQRTKHWALAVGVEGSVVNKTHQPDTILLLDTSSAEPSSFANFNARLRVSQTGSGSRRALSHRQKPGDGGKRKPATYLYEAHEWNAEAVYLLAAVRLRRLPSG
jgi:hypothetical protein